MAELYHKSYVIHRSSNNQYCRLYDVILILFIIFRHNSNELISWCQFGFESTCYLKIHCLRGISLF